MSLVLWLWSFPSGGSQLKLQSRGSFRKALKVNIAQSCPAVCRPWACPCGILQARIVEWVAFPPPADLVGILSQLSPQGSPGMLEWVAYPPPGHLPDPGVRTKASCIAQADYLPAEPPGKPEREGRVFNSRCSLGSHSRPAWESRWTDPLMV